MAAEMNQFTADLLQSLREMKADVRASETKMRASKAQITSTKRQAEKESLVSEDCDILPYCMATAQKSNPPV